MLQSFARVGARVTLDVVQFDRAAGRRAFDVLGQYLAHHEPWVAIDVYFPHHGLQGGREGFEAAELEVAADGQVSADGAQGGKPLEGGEPVVVPDLQVTPHALQVGQPLEGGEHLVAVDVQVTPHALQVGHLQGGKFDVLVGSQETLHGAQGAHANRVEQAVG